MQRFRKPSWFTIPLIIRIRSSMVVAELPRSFLVGPSPSGFVDSGTGHLEPQFQGEQIVQAWENPDLDALGAPFKKARSEKLGAALQTTDHLPGHHVHTSGLLLTFQLEPPSGSQSKLKDGVGLEWYDGDGLVWYDGSPQSPSNFNHPNRNSGPWSKWTIGPSESVNANQPGGENSQLKSLKHPDWVPMGLDVELSPLRYSSGNHQEDIPHPSQIHEERFDPHQRIRAKIDDTDSQRVENRDEQFRANQVCHLSQRPAVNSEPFLLNVEPPEIYFRRLRNLPRSIVEKELLRRYMSRYDKEVKNPRTWKCRKRPDFRWFGGGVPAAVVSGATELELDIGKQAQPSLIRLKSRLNIGNQIFATPSEFRSSFHILLKWLLFDLEAFLRKLRLTERIVQDGEILLNWLMTECFRPTISLPIMGEVKRPIPFYDWREFGPVQKLVIDSFYESRVNKCVHQTASNIIAIWYKNFDPQTWSYFSDEQSFWCFMERAVSAAGEDDNGKISTIVGGNQSRRRWLEDFEIYEIKRPKLIKSLELQKARARFQEAEKLILRPREKNFLQKIEQTIASEVKKFSKQCVESHRARTGGVSDVLAGLTVRKRQALDDGSRYVIRLLDKRKFMVPAGTLKQKLKSFQRRIHDYLTVFLAFLVCERKITLPDAHTHMTNWLYHQMFNPTQGLPLFGIYLGEFQPLKKEDFGAFQNLLLDLLGGQYSPDDYDQVYCTIIGYWFKSQQKEIWSIVFINDSEYWELMASALRSYLVPTKQEVKRPENNENSRHVWELHYSPVSDTSGNPFWI